MGGVRRRRSRSSRSLEAVWVVRCALLVPPLLRLARRPARRPARRDRSTGLAVRRRRRRRLRRPRLRRLNLRLRLQ